MPTIPPKEEDFPSEFKTKRFWLSIAAEFLGTGLLVYISTSVCNVSDTNVRRDINTHGNLECSLAYGLGLSTLVYWTEGLLNPALAVAFTSTGKLSLTKGILVIILEILGDTARLLSVFHKGRGHKDVLDITWEIVSDKDPARLYRQPPQTNSSNKAIAIEL